MRDYETVPEERTEANPLGLYTLTSERIRHLPKEEVERRRCRVEDERAARYRVVYDDLALRVVAHPDGTLEASWKFRAAVLRNGSDKVQDQARDAPLPLHAAPTSAVLPARGGLDVVLRR